jgi:hypothetical protein
VPFDISLTILSADCELSQLIQTRSHRLPKLA